MAHVSIAPVMRLRDYLRREEPAILFKQTLTSPGYVRMNACTRHQHTTIAQLHHGWNLPVPRIQSRIRHTCRTHCFLRPPTSDPTTPLHGITWHAQIRPGELQKDSTESSELHSNGRLYRTVFFTLTRKILQIRAILSALVEALHTVWFSILENALSQRIFYFGIHTSWWVLSHTGEQISPQILAHRTNCDNNIDAWVRQDCQWYRFILQTQHQ